MRDVQYVLMAIYLPRIQGNYQQYSPKWGFFFSDPITVVFWSKNRILYTAPQKRR